VTLAPNINIIRDGEEEVSFIDLAGL